MKNLELLKEKSLSFLEQLPLEKNHITDEWKELGIKPGNAAESQALIQLLTKYCTHKKCLDCQIGTLVLRNYSE